MRSNYHHLRLRRLIPVGTLASLLVCAGAARASDLVIAGAGSGHGVGMSQEGALGYAESGWPYQAILAHFYAGTAIGQVAAGARVRVSIHGKVHQIPLETYVRGVVSAEVPAGWPQAALEAQAVASRTFALTAHAGGSRFDVYADTRSQVYRGVAAQTPETNAAVAATTGQIVTYEGRPAITYFFASSGGRTENVENAWPGAQADPWLRGTSDPLDRGPLHRWTVTISFASAAADLRGLVRGSFQGIEVLRRGFSPRVLSAYVLGSAGRTVVSGSALAARLGLYGTWAYFSVRSGQVVRPEADLSGQPVVGRPSTPATLPTTGGGQEVVHASRAGGGSGASLGTGGGAQAPSAPLAGGSQYGVLTAAIAAPRPVVGVLRVPRTATAGRPPRVALRIDETGVGTVNVQVAVIELAARIPAIVVDMGWVRTARTVTVTWPRGATLKPGSYLVSVSAHDHHSGTLLRRARSSGVANLTVRAPASAPAKARPPSVAPPAPAPAPEAGVLTPAQSTAAGAVFPVAGPHTFGGPENRFGAPRTGHVHQGQDVLTAEGTPVVAPLAGTILTTSYQAGGAGYYAVERTRVGFDLMFAHCMAGSLTVSTEQAVSAGQALCQAGQTGSATTPHLHIEIWVGGWHAEGGHPIDPLPYLEAWDHVGAGG